MEVVNDFADDQVEIDRLESVFEHSHNQIIQQRSNELCIRLIISLGFNDSTKAVIKEVDKNWIAVFIDQVYVSQK